MDHIEKEYPNCRTNCLNTENDIPSSTLSEKKLCQRVSAAETKSNTLSSILSKEETHRRFGGIITKNDFEGYTSMVSVAEEICRDWKFDERCEKAVYNRKQRRLNVDEEGVINAKTL